MTYKLRRDLAAGYYQAFFYIDDSLKVGINIWLSAYDGSSTEEDDNTKLDYDFSIGDNQQTPYAGYNQVMDFGVNLTNAGLKRFTMSAWICSLTQILRNSRLISMRATITVKWGIWNQGRW
ncbi:MAG: hypothetical protein ACLT76_02035 [Clostridium fessum]